MPAGASVKHRIDQRDPDRAAEVSHHVEQAAGVRHLLVRQHLQRHPGRRQQAEHRREAAQDLRPEHLVEIGGAAFERAHAEADGEQAESERRQPARIDPALQRAGDRRGHQLGCARHQHDRADLQRIVLPDIGEKHRHQIDRAEQSDAEAEAEPAADRKRPHFQRASSTTGCTAVTGYATAAATAARPPPPRICQRRHPYLFFACAWADVTAATATSTIADVINILFKNLRTNAPSRNSRPQILPQSAMDHAGEPLDSPESEQLPPKITLVAPVKARILAIEPKIAMAGTSPAIAWEFRMEADVALRPVEELKRVNR